MDNIPETLHTARMEKELKNLRSDVDLLMSHRAECEFLHDQHKEHSKRSGDAINNNTEATLMLAKSMTDNAVMMSKLSDSVDKLTEQAAGNQPEIDAVKDWRTTWKNNKVMIPLLLSLTGAIITGIITSAALVYHYLSGLS